MIFEVGKFYMHRRMKDVCIEVAKFKDQTVRHVMLQVRYWNLGYTGRPWLIDDRLSIIFINTQDIPDWIHLDEDVLTMERRTDGPPIV